LGIPNGEVRIVIPMVVVVKPRLGVVLLAGVSEVELHRLRVRNRGCSSAQPRSHKPHLHRGRLKFSKACRDPLPYRIAVGVGEPSRRIQVIGINGIQRIANLHGNGHRALCCWQIDVFRGVLRMAGLIVAQRIARHAQLFAIHRVGDLVAIDHLAHSLAQRVALVRGGGAVFCVDDLVDLPAGVVFEIQHTVALQIACRVPLQGAGFIGGAARGLGVNVTHAFHTVVRGVEREIAHEAVETVRAFKLAVERLPAIAVGVVAVIGAQGADEVLQFDARRQVDVDGCVRDAAHAPCRVIGDAGGNSDRRGRPACRAGRAVQVLHDLAHAPDNIVLVAGYAVACELACRVVGAGAGGVALNKRPAPALGRAQRGPRDVADERLAVPVQAHDLACRVVLIGKGFAAGVGNGLRLARAALACGHVADIDVVGGGLRWRRGLECRRHGAIGGDGVGGVGVAAQGATAGAVHRGRIACIGRERDAAHATGKAKFASAAAFNTVQTAARAGGKADGEHGEEKSSELIA